MLKKVFVGLGVNPM